MRTLSVTDCTRVSHGAHGDVRRPAYAISRAQPAHLWRDAPDRRRPSSGARGVGVAAPYGLCVWVGVSINHSCPPSGAELDAAGRRDQLHPRLPRCACLASTTQLMQSRGHSPHTIFTGAPTSSFLPHRAGVEARPYGMFGRAKRTGLRTGPFCAEMPEGVSGRVFYEYSSPEKARMETRAAATAAMASMKTVNQSVLMPKAAIISSISFTSAAPAAVTRQSIRA